MKYVIQTTNDKLRGVKNFEANNSYIPALQIMQVAYVVYWLNKVLEDPKT